MRCALSAWWPFLLLSASGTGRGSQLWVSGRGGSFSWGGRGGGRWTAACDANEAARRPPELPVCQGLVQLERELWPCPQGRPSPRPSSIIGLRAVVPIPSC